MPNNKSKTNVSENKKAVATATATAVNDQITDSVTSPAVAVKRVFQSKVIWVNVLALLALFVQKKYGFVINEELQMELLTFINIALRFITHEKVSWK